MIQKTLIVSVITFVVLSGCSDSSTLDGFSEAGNNASVTGNTSSGTVNNDGTDNSGETDPNSQNPSRKFKPLSSAEFYAALREGLVQQRDEIDEPDTGFVALNRPSIAEVGPEVGVDELEDVISDDEFLYVLEHQYAHPHPEEGVVSDSALEQVAQSEVEPSEQGADNGNVSIDVLPISSAGDNDDSAVASPKNANKIRILALKNNMPDAVPVTELEVNLDGSVADGMYLYKDDAQRNLILTSTSLFNRDLYNWDDAYPFNNSSSLISKLDVTNPTQPRVEQSLKIDGQIISSRRVDDKLYVVSRFNPVVPNVDPTSMTTEEYKAAIAAADLSQSLPKITLNDGSKAELVNSAECFLATFEQSADYYFTPDIVSLAVIDLNTLQLQDSECFFGSVSALYVTPKSVYLVTTRWNVDTDFHQFTINDSELNYSGSGVVSGYLGSGQYLMSEKDGHLRVATISSAGSKLSIVGGQNESVSPILLSVLNVAGDGELVNVAELPNANNPEHIGNSGGSIYAIRFSGDRAYFAGDHTDRLYVVDLSNPAGPELNSGLELKADYDYLQPIGEDYLLGIGMGIVLDSGDLGEIAQGIKLSLFNVTDTSNPIEVQSIVVGERGTDSGFLLGRKPHLAITVQSATDSHPARIAFGIDVHGLANPPANTNDPSFSFPWSFSGLHGFDIKVGSDAGIEPIGVMMVNSASNPRSDDLGNGQSEMVGDSIYYIRNAEVFAATWSDLGNFSGPR